MLFVDILLLVPDNGDAGEWKERCLAAERRVEAVEAELTEAAKRYAVSRLLLKKMWSLSYEIVTEGDGRPEA